MYLLWRVESVSAAVVAADCWVTSSYSSESPALSLEVSFRDGPVDVTYTGLMVFDEGCSVGLASFMP